MPAVRFDPGLKSKSVFDTDQFRLEANEKARIVIMDDNLQMQYVHYVRSMRDGKETGSYYVCLGSLEVMSQPNGADIENCPCCAVAEPHREAVVSVARRRFVVYIARYRTNRAGEVITPISLALQAWVFGDDKYNKLTDRASEHGDLRRHDIIITCTSKQYQQMDLDVSPTARFMTDKSAMEQYKTIRAARSTEIDRLLGKGISRVAMEQLVGTASATESDELDLDKGELGGIFKDGVQGEVNINDFLGGLGSDEDSPQESKDEADFSSLLSG